MNTKEINILFLLKDSGIGGVVSSTKSLCDGLKKEHISTYIITNVGLGEKKMLKDYDKTIVNFNTRNFFTIIHNYKVIAQTIKKRGINIIHCQNRIPAIYAMIYCTFHRKVKYIWVNHLVPIPTSFFYRKSTFYGSCAVTDCILGEQLLHEKLKISQKKIRVINLGIDISKFKPISNTKKIELKKNLGLSQYKVILLYGRLVENKGFLLNALSKCKNNLSNLRFIFPGENEKYKQKLLVRACELGLEKNLIFPGFIDGIEMLSITDLMVLPSKHESFGISNIEAFAMGVPVIRTKNGGYEDMKDICFGIKYGDEEGLAKLIDEFIENPNKYKKLGTRAQQESSRFSIEVMTKNYIDLYRNI